MKASYNRNFVAVSGVALAIALSHPAAAQDTPPPAAATTEAAPADQPQEPDIIITGRAAGSGINKLEAGYSVTTMSADQIKLQAPKSTGDALKSIPGVWVESSGGVGTSNVFVRGIPSTGDAPFVTMQFNGIPVYGSSSLSFMDQTAMVRIDETVAGIEGVNGGPASLYSDGQPGLTTNLRLREGHDQTQGSIGASITDYSAWRTDGYLSGKLADDLYYMVGGYVSRGDSVRRAGFDTEKGQQITANITKKFSGGKINVFARYTDDHGEWFLPFAADVPGLDLGRYNQLNQYTRYATIIKPGAAGSGATERVDLADGRGWKGVVTGANVDYDFGGGFEFTDRFGFTSGTLQTMGLVPAGAGAVTVATALATAGAANPGQTMVHTINTGQTLASTDYVQQFGSWVVEKKLQNISNEAVLNFKSGPNTLNLGYYYSHFTSDDVWSLGGNRWMQVGGSGDLVDLNNGPLSAFDISDRGTATVNAIYVSDSFNITDALRLDAGIRHQWTDIDFNITGNGLPNSAKIRREATPWTIGLNYRATSNFDVYARASQGYHSPSFDDVRSQLGNTGPRLDLNWSVRSYEGGVKYRGHGLEASLTGFYDKVVGAVYNDVGVPPQIAGSKTKGIELDASWRSASGFGFTGNAVLEDAKTDTPNIPDFDGKKAQRIPSYQVRFTPTYTATVGDDSDLTLYSTFEAIGKRYSDLANTQLLPAYATLSAGLRAKVKGYTLQIAGDNLTDSHGLTEGNPRFLAGPGAALPDVRPIFGRSYKVSVSYAF
jgi:outer membrane receptor protein involved in Fe transport